MNPYTYGTLYNDLQEFNEDFSLDLQQNLPRIIQDGELRCIRDLDLSQFDVSVVTTAGASTTTGLIAKPSLLIRDRIVTLMDPTGATSLAILVKRTNQFVAEYNLAYSQAALPAAQPKYFCDSGLGNFQLSPVPDLAYQLNVNGIFVSPLLGDNDETNSPAAIAAAQHTTGNTALTLTSSPYVYTTPAPLSLTSTGNMSANTFTVVGLDANGNQLTVVMAGPNAGFVSTEEFFSQINSITPNTTDGVNSVSAGFYSDNTSWLSLRFPDLLFQACMIEATYFLKRFSARQVAIADYNEKLADALQQTRNMQRSDLEDLFVNRQLVTGPPMEQVPGPSPQGAQQQGQG